MGANADIGMKKSLQSMVAGENKYSGKTMEDARYENLNGGSRTQRHAAMRTQSNLFYAAKEP